MKSSNSFALKTPKNYFILAIWLFIIAFGGKFVLRDAIQYFGFEEETFGRWWDFKWALIGHISGGLLAITIGPFQFWKAFRQKNTKLHRSLGVAYLIGILIASLSSTYLAWTTAVDVHWTWALSLQGLAFSWFCTVLMAYRAVRLHRYKIHKEWMIRSYVVTFGFVLFRYMDDVTRSMDIGTFIERSPSLIWISWAIPLFITEMVLQWNKKN